MDIRRHILRATGAEITSPIVNTIVGSSANFNGRADLILVNTPVFDYDEVERTHGSVLPVLGLAYIATFAAKNGLNIKLIDAEAHGLGIKRVVDLIAKEKPRWVGLNLLSPTYHNSRAILAALHRVAPDIHVMLGGHQATAMAEHILKDESIPRVDALIRGEAETRVVEILKDIRARQHLPQVYWRESDGSIGYGRGEKTWLYPVLDDLPPIDRDFVTNEPDIDAAGNRWATMNTSRGCPFSCTFCGSAFDPIAAKLKEPDLPLEQLITRGLVDRMRRQGLDHVIKEMKALRDRMGILGIRFSDDLFLLNPRRVVEVAEAFLAAKLDMIWQATARISTWCKRLMPIWHNCVRLAVWPWILVLNPETTTC